MIYIKESLVPLVDWMVPVPNVGWFTTSPILNIVKVFLCVEMMGLLLAFSLFWIISKSSWRKFV